MRLTSGYTKPTSQTLRGLTTSAEPMPSSSPPTPKAVSPPPICYPASSPKAISVHLTTPRPSLGANGLSAIPTFFRLRIHLDSSKEKVILIKLPQCPSRLLAPKGDTKKSACLPCVVYTSGLCIVSARARSFSRISSGLRMLQRENYSSSKIRRVRLVWRTRGRWRCVWRMTYGSCSSRR